MTAGCLRQVALGLRVTPRRTAPQPRTSCDTAQTACSCARHQTPSEGGAAPLFILLPSRNSYQATAPSLISSQRCPRPTPPPPPPPSPPPPASRPPRSPPSPSPPPSPWPCSSSSCAAAAAASVVAAKDGVAGTLVRYVEHPCVRRWVPLEGSASMEEGGHSAQALLLRSARALGPPSSARRGVPSH